MKQRMFFILFMCSTIVWGQEKKEVKFLHFCGEKISVPLECQAGSDYELTCEDFSLQWMYLEPDMLSFAPQQYINQMDERLKKFRKRGIKLMSLGKEIDGYLISHKDDKEIKYKIVAYGTVNNQPVLIHLSMLSEPKNNEALPVHVRQFLTLK